MTAENWEFAWPDPRVRPSKKVGHFWTSLVGQFSTSLDSCQPASHWSAVAAPRARNPPAAEKGAFARRLKLRHQIRRLPERSHSDGNGCQCLFSGEWHGNWRNRFQMDCAAVFLTVSTAKNEKNSSNYYRIPRIFGVFCQTLIMRFINLVIQYRNIESASA